MAINGMIIRIISTLILLAFIILLWFWMYEYDISTLRIMEKIIPLSACNTVTFYES